ncbi:uncharacterized protein LOC126879902 [Diabrotica virgifera virgifera]|uniref:CHK kinase-like domain-containing protein n=1 Tax=Diabrotica virgifera virgifera TaxID=50390 RepID=A0ABM5JMN8_DIAVI|nr:uncharacterized protein LOC126879902 [Diabrotica virgifera virgifera]
MFELTEHHKQLIDEVARKKGFTDYELTVAPCLSKGGNFMGIVSAVTIHNSEKKMEVVLKSAFSYENEKPPKMLSEAYKREIYMYTRIFNEFFKFQEEYGIIEPFNSVTKIQNYSDVEGSQCLIMENLKTGGYQLWDKTIPLTPEHMEKVIQEYARFHAVSFAMKHKNPKLFEELTSPIERSIFDNEDMISSVDKSISYVTTLFKNVYEAIEGDTHLTEYAKEIETKLPQHLWEGIRRKDVKCVVSHGDCWCNNFMFKYKEPQNRVTPSKICIIDWQLASLNSPLYDFAYFFLVHADKETLNKYEEYLDLYYNTLSKQLENFDCDPQEVFPYATFEEHANFYGFYQVLIAIIVLKIMLCESEDAPEFSDALEDMDKMIAGMEFDVKNKEVYHNRLKDLFEFLNSRNF